jgi:hypothetical protein
LLARIDNTLVVCGRAVRERVARRVLVLVLVLDFVLVAVMVLG